MSKKPPIQGGSSLGPDVLEEYLALVEEMEGKPKDAGIPEEFDDVLLGQHAKDDAEKNYQRGQEMAITLATTGWGYAVESWNKMVLESKKTHDEATADEDILRTFREWKALEQAVKRLIANVESAAQVPHPDELPEG
jgi:hypothetical protein